MQVKLAHGSKTPRAYAHSHKLLPTNFVGSTDYILVRRYSCYNFEPMKVAQLAGVSRRYTSQRVGDALRRQGAGAIHNLNETRYRPDPCMRDGSSADPPPCDRIFHTYGEWLRRFPLTPLRNCLLTPELQWRSG